MMGSSVSRGNVRDCLDVARHLVEHALGVGTGLELHDYGCPALGCRRHDLPDAVDVVDGLLDADDDPGLDFLRRRSEIGHLDSDAVEIEFREHHLGDRRCTREAAHDDRDHQQVCRDGIAGQPVDRAIHGTNLPRRPPLPCRPLPAISITPRRAPESILGRYGRERSVDALARAMILAWMRRGTNDTDGRGSPESPARPASGAVILRVCRSPRS